MKTLFSHVVIFACLAVSAAAQITALDVPDTGGGMSLSPARFELEMKPGTETTVVLNLDYRAGSGSEPVRIVATLNDWNITKDGRVEYFRANTQSNSASPWLIHTPGEANVSPGTVHQIRVTVSVPLNAVPGDHLAALIIEQRPEKLSSQTNLRQMVVRYRMASVFYIKVPGLTRRGSIEDLYAEATPSGIVVTPMLKNDGNSMIRPLASIKVLDESGSTVANLPESEQLPILAGAELNQSHLIDKVLAPGKYSVKYRIDFQDGGKVTEGITDLIVRNAPQIAASGKPTQKP